VGIFPDKRFRGFALTAILLPMRKMDIYFLLGDPNTRSTQLKVMLKVLKVF